MMEWPPSATVFSPWVELEGLKLDLELLELAMLLVLLMLVVRIIVLCSPTALPPWPCFEADLSLRAEVRVWWILIEEPLLLLLYFPDLCTSSKLLWLPTDRGDRDGAVYLRLDAWLPGETAFIGPAIGTLDRRVKELLVLLEYVDVVELVSPMSISTIGIFLGDVAPSSFVNVPCRTKGALGLVVPADLLDLGEIDLTGDFVTLAELEPER